MDTAPIQNAIKLIGFQVHEVEFKLDPSCFPDGTPPKVGTLSVELGFSIGFSELKNNNYSVVFKTAITDSSNYLKIVIKSVGVFETEQPITDEFKKSQFVILNSPAIAFPFLRSFVTTLTSNAGIPPIFLPAFNFSRKG